VVALSEPEHKTRRRWSWRLGVLVAVIALAIGGAVLSVTAFGSSSSESIASVSESETTTTNGEETTSLDQEEAALAFAQCMRDSGVPNFPDPVANADGTFDLQRPQGVDPNALFNALDNCRSELQASGIQLGGGHATQDPEVQDALLEFAQCMRENGVPEFQDPQPNSGIRGLFGDINPQSARVQEAMETCRPVLSELGGPFAGTGG
jgi:hypothetical protein